MTEDWWSIWCNSVLHNLSTNVYSLIYLVVLETASDLWANREQEHFMQSLSQEMKENWNI